MLNRYCKQPRGFMQKKVFQFNSRLLYFAIFAAAKNGGNP